MAKTKISASNKKKLKKTVENVIVKVHASFNNTITTITTTKGDTLCWATAGTDYKGSRKSTPFAAQVATEKAMTKAIEAYGVTSVEIEISGPGPGREAAVRAVIAISKGNSISEQDGLEDADRRVSGNRSNARPVFKITSIKDVTGLAFNGCRPPKKRRV